jgi:hypothetical protein
MRHRRATATALLLSVSVLLTACAGPDQTGTLQQRVRAYTSSTQLGQNIGTLYGDGQRIAEVVRLHRGTGAIHTDCGVLETDTANVEENLPSPDITLTLELNSAVTLDYEAGTDCYNGGGTNAALMNKSSRLLAQADTELRKAVARVEVITGHPVSTTTTTSPDSGSMF